MRAEVHGLKEFYATPAGAVASRLVRERLHAMWPDLLGMAVLGIGYPGPYLRLWKDQAARCIALTPPQTGPCRWPRGDPSATLVAEEECLPFPDLVFDRVLLVHGLESAETARRLLREVWRVLKDDGRVIAVVPNRRGGWAHVERTPFGHGHPYSPGQLGRLFERQMFRVERREAALFAPPWRGRLALRASVALEHVGRHLWPMRFAGLAIVEAEKDSFSAVPAGAVSARRNVLSPGWFQPESVTAFDEPAENGRR
jgi:SAM-dependent methyltransferase